MRSPRFHPAASLGAAALAAVFLMPGIITAQEAAAPVKAAETVDPAPAEPACDPSYVGVCIPPPPPDLDCGDALVSGCSTVELVAEPDADDGYGGEVAGAIIGGVISFYGLGILFGGVSFLLIIPGALIGMGIGSRF